MLPSCKLDLSTYACSSRSAARVCCYIFVRARRHLNSQSQWRPIFCQPLYQPGENLVLLFGESFFFISKSHLATASERAERDVKSRDNNNTRQHPLKRSLISAPIIIISSCHAAVWRGESRPGSRFMCDTHATTTTTTVLVGSLRSA